MSTDVIDILKMARPSVRNLKPYASAKDEFKDFDKELIFLDANENPYETGLNRYPDPHQKELKERIAVLKQVSSDHILLGNGSDEILDMIFRVFFEPEKDNIIINTPTFGMFKVLSDINAISCRAVQMTTDFQLDVASIKKNIDAHTKAIFICSPNNPTGNAMNEASILELLKLPVLVIIDEAYIDFSDTDSWSSRLKEFKNLIVSQTFSKAFGLAGIRLGACFAHAEVIDLLKKVKMPYNVNVLTQRTALESLADEKLIAQQVFEIKENRKKLVKSLSKIGFVKHIYPSDSNFLLVKVDNANRRYDELVTKELVVRNRTKEPLCNNCLRITVGTEEENKYLLKRMAQLDAIKNSDK
ncbi:histidinol-phosphate transaminase [Lutimonas sp.]|uniref:histidinol-phosphate transaminase n=1 Tax=Lutimonas sp. TaxID=1872403 RepID=UPI003D9BED62